MDILKTSITVIISKTLNCVSTIYIYGLPNATLLYLCFKVKIKFPSEDKKITIHESLVHVVKNLALKSYKTAFKKAMEVPELKDILVELVVSLMNKECNNLCKKKPGSILRDTSVSALTAFSLKDFHKEFTSKAPITAKMLTTLCISDRSQTEACDPNVVSTVSAVILHSRCPEMSAFAYRLGFILRHAGIGNVVGRILTKSDIICPEIFYCIQSLSLFIEVMIA